MLPPGVPAAWMGQWRRARERAASQLRVSRMRSRVRWLLEQALLCNVGGGPRVEVGAGRSRGLGGAGREGAGVVQVFSESPARWNGSEL